MESFTRCLVWRLTNVGGRRCEEAEDLRVWVGHLGGGRLSVVRSESESMKSSLDSGWGWRTTGLGNLTDSDNAYFVFIYIYLRYPIMLVF